MALHIHERTGSRSVSTSRDGANETIEYSVTGTLDENEAYDLVAVTAPPVYNSLGRSKIDLKPQGGLLWYATVEYESRFSTSEGDLPPEAGGNQESALPDSSDPLTAEFSFDTAGGNAHITQSLETMSSTPAAGVAALPDYKRVIGVHKDRVDGCDILTGKLELTIQKKWPRMTMNYLLILKQLTGKSNTFPWGGFASDEILFLGGTGRYVGDGRNDHPWEVTYRFAISESEYDIEIAPGLVVPEKKGWHYLWVDYLDEVDPAAFVALQRPRGAWVERVYDHEDFALLGLGR